MTGYVAPASKVFTVAHVRDDAPPENVGPGGATICLIPMDPAECWQPVTLQPGDRVCPFCADPSQNGSEQEALL
jgi:hypothetical protein